MQESDKKEQPKKEPVLPPELVAKTHNGDTVGLIQRDGKAKDKDVVIIKFHILAGGFQPIAFSRTEWDEFSKAITKSLG